MKCRTNSVGKADIAALALLSAAAGALGVWSELKAEKPDSLYMQQTRGVSGIVCFGELNPNNACNVGADGSKFSALVASFANENHGPGAPDSDAITWVSGQDGFGQPGERDIDTGIRFDATLFRGPDHGGLANASNTGVTSVTVMELLDGEVVEEYDADVVYALVTRGTAPPTVVPNEKIESWLEPGNFESFHSQQLWKNGGEDRPEALEGTITMIVDGDVWFDEAPLTSGWSEMNHRQFGFPGNVPEQPSE